MFRFMFRKERFIFIGKSFNYFFIILFAFFLFNSNLSAQPSGAMGAIAAIDETPSGKTGSKVSGAVGKSEQTNNSAGNKQKIKSENTKSRKTSTTSSKNSASNKKSQNTEKSVKSKPYDGFVIGDEYVFLNYEITEKVQPIYRIKAKEAGATGLVQVVVLIGEDGSVLQAKARSGNKLLHDEAEKAALATKFNKPVLYGKPARATGFIVYRFGKSEN